jgi:octaprenyl-diphosphate synthase
MKTVSQTNGQQNGASNPLQVLYAPISGELRQVEELLAQELRNRHDHVDELVRYGCLLGGKRLRPCLLLLSAKAIGDVVADHITLAAVVEMIHTATLIHDDVLDEAEQRRHLATCNARWDNEASVLLGDYLFTHAFYLASTLESTYGCRTIGKATNVVCEGELRQVCTRGEFSLSEADYLEIIESKTGELCACSCELGAHFAGADPEAVKQMAEYGRCLGIAFQIADDLLDILGDEATTGKSLGTDLEKQKPTLPLIHVWQQASESEREQLQEILNLAPADCQEQLTPWFARFDAIDYTRNRALEYAGKASKVAAALPPSDARDVLMLMADFVVARSA